MKSIMISIQPQWVEKILNREKTIEIRKTMPKCELPCKVYIYCSKAKPYLYRIDDDNNFKLTNKLRFEEDCFVKDYNAQNGKVVAEFTLNIVDFWQPYWIPEVLHICTMSKLSCMDINELQEYSKGERIYAWHIGNLKIYDKPKELSEFRKELDCDDYPCNKNRDCKYNYYDYSEGCWACGIDFDGSNCIYKQIKRPPQSWCYVEEIIGNENLGN